MLGLLLQLAIVSRAPIDTAQPVNFHAMVTPDTVFVGQQLTYDGARRATGRRTRI
jgi:hypothetical protein